jgi:hypothetical protein
LRPETPAIEAPPSSPHTRQIAASGDGRATARLDCGKTVEGWRIGCARRTALIFFSADSRTNSQHRPIVVQLRTALRLRGESYLLESVLAPSLHGAPDFSELCRLQRNDQRTRLRDRGASGWPRPLARLSRATRSDDGPDALLRPHTGRGRSATCRLAHTGQQDTDGSQKLEARSQKLARSQKSPFAPAAFTSNFWLRSSHLSRVKNLRLP